MEQRQRRTSKAEQREATISRLLGVARQAFATHGYAAAATEEMVRQAGVTRGALYHHFGSKEGLFRAVLAQVHEDIGRQVGAAADAAADEWQALREGCRAFLVAANESAIQRIMLIDGPAVLGWGAWRALDEQHSMHQLREHLVLLMQQGVIQNQPVAALAHLLSGAMNELALWIAQQPDTARAAQEAWTALERVLEGLHSA